MVKDFYLYVEITANESVPHFDVFFIGMHNTSRMLKMVEMTYDCIRKQKNLQKNKKLCI